jgi:hypothetical protein
MMRADRVAQLAEHWASSNPTVARHIFQACPVSSEIPDLCEIPDLA